MKNNLIYDIGMHNGDDTAFYLSLGYEVIAVEASPDLAEKAAKRFGEALDNNRLTILNMGINAVSGHCDFYLNRADSVWNSFNKELGARGGKGFDIIKIKTGTLAEIIAQFGCPYFLKIDIEGYDIVCLESLITTIQRPNYISVELSYRGIIDKLQELGYDQFKIIEQWSFLNMELPFTTKYKAQMRHQRFMYSMNFMVRVVRKLFGKAINRFYETKYLPKTGFKHPFGSSGTFGKGLAGKWMDFEEAVKVFTYYSENGKRISGREGYEFWADIHATTLKELNTN